MKTMSLRIGLIFLSLQSHLVYADPPPSPTSVAAGAAGATAGAIVGLALPPGCPESVNADLGLNKLFLMGKSLIQLEPSMRIGRCVKAKTDSAARSACTTLYPTVVNPLNPQYGENYVSAGVRSWGNSRTSSEEEVYYCITSPRTIPQIKAARCAEAQSDRSCNVGGAFTFTYSGANRNNSGEYADGDCVRSGPGVSSRDADRLVCAENPEGAGSSEAAATADPAEPAAAAAATPAPTPTDSLARLNQCITHWRSLGQSCKTGAEDAVTQCTSTRNQNNLVNGVGGVLGAMGQGVAAVHQGQGVQGTCFRAGAAALAARAALDTTKQNCTAGETFCSSSCQVSQVDAMINECLQAGGFASLSQLQTAHPEIASNLQDAKTEVTENFNEGHDLCTNQVRTRRMSLDSVVSDLGRTLQASTVCSCQTSSSNGTNCNQIPTIDVCQANPAATGCQAYIPLGACSAGSPYYNAQVCNCTQNPSASGCSAVVSPPVVSSFGGNLAGGSAPLNSGGSVSLGAGVGGSSGGGSFNDLSIPGGGGTAVPANFANNIKAGEISSGAGATGASVGGGGNGSGGLAGGTVSGTAGPPAEKNLGSLFKDLKNVVSNVFGGGRTANPSAQKANGGINIDRFKPSPQLRGGPVQRDVASANEKTLFELVNECANGLRCKNSGNLMVNP